MAACVLLATAASVIAQSPSAKPGAPADPYGAEPVVIVRLDTVGEMHADGTGYADRTGIVRVQSEAMVKQFGVLSVPFAGSSGKVEFRYARVRHPDGTITETPGTDMLEEPAPVTREAPFYSDLKAAELPVRGLRVGDTLEWQTRSTLLKAEAPGQFWGQETFVTDGIALEESYELRVPASVHLKSWTNPESTAKLTETTDGATHILHWTHQNLKPTVGPAADARKAADKDRALSLAEQLDAEQGKLPDIAWTTFPDWQSVGAWYRGLEADRMQPDATVKAKVAELTAGKTTQEEKVRAVYTYVATQIHYVGVAFGIGRYQPHTAAEILSSQYGDCKDKHTLLASMLIALGLQPDAVLIGAEIRFNEAVPAPQSFNHLITRVQVDGKPVWLDSTTEVAPYRMLLATLRDKQALVVPPQGSAAVQRTPAELPFAFSQVMTAKGTLDEDGLSTSRITLTYRGDQELFLREVVRQITPAQYDDLTQRLVTSMGYGGTTSHSEVGRPDDTAQPFTISFDYRREKAGDWDNRRIVAQLAPVGLPTVDPKDPPKQPIELMAPRTEESHATLQLPPGWSAELPEAVHEASPYATYDLTFHLDKGLLTVDRRVTVLQRQVPLAEWKKYQAWQDAVGLGNESFIQLTTTAAAEGDNVPSTGSAPAARSSAAGLVQEAGRELDAHQLQQAQTTLDRARNLDSSARGLWNGYGFLEFSRGEPDAAIRDYKKELDQHPGQAWTLQHLVALQISANKHADAAETLHTWIAADPANSAPVIILANLLIEDGKPGEAVTTVKASLPQLSTDGPSTDNLQIALGQAEIKAGMAKDAMATLAPLLQSNSPNSLNSAAYELADASLDLPLTETAERNALSKLEAETSAWTLHEAPGTLAQTSSLLAASWDTMGWILFREGKTAEAEPFLEAARRSQHAWVISEHLGEVKLAEGDSAGALAAFQEADAMLPRVDAMGIHRDPGPDAKDLEQKIDRLKQTTKASTLSDPASQQGRTFPLGSAQGRAGTAEYRLLLSREKIETFVPVTTKEVPNTAALFANFKTAVFFPPASGARLAKTGFVNCHSGVCELVLQP